MLQQPRVREGESFHQFKRRAHVATFPNDFSRYVDSENKKTYFWKPGKFHVVTDADLAKAVLKNQKFSADRSSFFMSRMPNLDLSLIQDFFSVVQKMMVMSDGEDHKRKRSASNMGFEDHVLEKFKDKVHHTVDTLVTDALKNKKINFVDDVANKLPSTVLADLFCIPEKDREDFVNSSLSMTAFFGGGTGYENADGIKVNKSAVALREYFRDLIARRKLEPGEDYVSSLLQNQVRFALTDEEIVSQAIMMLVAGQVTTSDQICNNMFQIASDRSLQEKLKQNPALIMPAIEELKRFDPAVTFIFRVAAEDLSIGDQPVKKGDTIFICSHAINRNGVENGYQIDIHRSAPQNHFAYGHGVHYCIGARLARMEMQTLFERVIQQFPMVDVAEAERDHYSLSFSGFKTLKLVGTS